jgi:hypothetical protein
MYATEQKFDGQRASIGRSVIVIDRGRIYAALVVSVSDDKPTMRTLNADASAGSDSLYGTYAVPCPYLSCPSVEALAAATSERDSNRDACFWTWPPRV